MHNTKYKSNNGYHRRRKQFIMGNNKNFTHRQKKRLYEFVNVTLLLTEEESAAIHHQIPMTQELFEKCIDHCTAIDAQFTLNSILNEYPEFSIGYVKNEKGVVDAGLPVNVSEHPEIVWRKLCAKIKKLYGEDLL